MIRVSRASSLPLASRRLLLFAGNRERIVPLNRELTVTLDEYVTATTDTGHVFVDEFSGEPFAPEVISRTISGWFRSLGLPYTAHQLRHRFGTEAYEATSDALVVQELLGHSSPLTTAGYTKVRDGRKREAVDAMR
jgi:integrase